MLLFVAEGASSKADSQQPAQLSRQSARPLLNLVVVEVRRFREEKHCGCHCPHRLVIRTSRCGRGKLGSKILVWAFWKRRGTAWQRQAASLLQGCGLRQFFRLPLFFTHLKSAHHSQSARVVKGVDLRSTASNCAWVQTPWLTLSRVQASCLTPSTSQVQGRANPAFSKPCLCLSDTRHFRHFRCFRGSEERNPSFQCVIFVIYVKTAPSCPGTETRFTKKFFLFLFLTVCATPSLDHSHGLEI